MVSLVALAGSNTGVVSATSQTTRSRGKNQLLMSSAGVCHTDIMWKLKLGTAWEKTHDDRLLLVLTASAMTACCWCWQLQQWTLGNFIRWKNQLLVLSPLPMKLGMDDSLVNNSNQLLISPPLKMKLDESKWWIRIRDPGILNAQLMVWILLLKVKTQRKWNQQLCGKCWVNFTDDTKWTGDLPRITHLAYHSLFYFFFLFSPIHFFSSFLCRFSASPFFHILTLWTLVIQRRVDILIFACTRFYFYCIHTSWMSMCCLAVNL